MKQVNAYRSKVRQRVAIFIQALARGSNDLNITKPREATTAAIETLSKVRNHGPGKNSMGIILLDLYFAVP